jgi:hypothetical protein
MSLSHAAQSGQHPHADRGLDLYETDKLAVEALLREEKLPHCIWEPAAGRGAIARVLREHGHTVITSDIEDRGGLHFVADFLTTTATPAGTEAIVSNPPFKIIEPFIAHALTLCSRVIMLARLLFLEGGTGRARRHQLRRQILDATPPARVYVFRDRLPRMHRDGWEGNKASSSIAFAWFVWDRNHTGQTIITRITARADRVSSVTVTTPMTASSETGDVMTKPKPTLVPETPDTPETSGARNSGPPPDSDQNPDPAVEPTSPTAETQTAGMSQAESEQLDEEEKEFRALRRDLPGVKGASAAGIVAISVGKTPSKNEFFRTHKEFRPIVPIVAVEVGMERQFFAVTNEMVEPLNAIGITVTDHVLYLTVTSRGALRIVPVRQANSDGEQNEYHRTKEIGLMQGMDKWVRLFTDQENRCYKVFPALAGCSGDPMFPALKPAKIFRLAFRDRGRLVDSVEHPLFKKWAARDSQ